MYKRQAYDDLLFVLADFNYAVINPIYEVRLDGQTLDGGLSLIHILCGACAEACPVNAISFEADTVVTDPEKCIQCMACTAVCPQNVRILPPPVKEMIEQMLGAFKAIRRENEAFL